MRRRSFLKLSALAAAANVIPAHAATVSGIMSPVLKRGYDNLVTGCNSAETVFTQANVSASGIRKYFSLPMEGDARGAEAQILIAPSITVNDGTTRDIAIVASMNNTVWCYDANSSDDLWMEKLAVPVNGSKNIDAWGINDHWGVLSTPVIDLDTKRIYCVAWTDQNGAYATAYYQMHVLNLKDGSRVCPPITIEGTSNGQTWNKMMRKQRSSLLLTNVNGRKTVFFGCGTVQETSSGAAGWIVAFDCSSNRVSASLALTSGEGAGIWMGGSSLCADAAGSLYAVTGNGGFDGAADFGESIIKVNYNGSSLKVVDWWTPWTDSGREGRGVTGQAASMMKSMKLAGVNASTQEPAVPVNMAHMNAVAKPNGSAAWADEDLGSAPPILIPEYNLIISAGKDGIAYVVNLSNMGKTKPADFNNAAANYAKLVQPPYWLTYYDAANPAPQDPTTLDFQPDGKTRHMHSSPVYHNSILFAWGENAPLRAFRVSTAGLAYLAQGNEIASANSTGSGGMPGGFMCISANGTTAGTAILWACIPYGDANKTVTNGRLLAYDAENFVNGSIRVLWDSQAQNIPFIYNKFCPPTVDGGKLFVPTYADQYDVYGLSA